MEHVVCAAEGPANYHSGFVQPHAAARQRPAKDQVLPRVKRNVRDRMECDTDDAMPCRERSRLLARPVRIVSPTRSDNPRLDQGGADGWIGPFELWMDHLSMEARKPRTRFSQRY